MAINEGIGCKNAMSRIARGSYRGSWCADERAKFGLGDPLINFERIKAMSVEELAELLLDGCRGSKCDDQPKNEWGSLNCFQCRVTWLQQPA